MVGVGAAGMSLNKPHVSSEEPLLPCATPTYASWSAVPQELILSHVLGVLAPQHVRSLRLVNHDTEHLVNTSITHLDLDPSAASHPAISTKFPHVRSLSFKDSPDRILSDHVLSQIVSACAWPALTHLDLKRSPHVAAGALRTALAAYPATASLHLPTWTDDLMLRATTTLTALTSLDLGDSRLNVRMVSDRGLAALSTHTALAHVSFERCNSITDAGIAVLSACPNLATVNLSSTYVSAQGLRHLAACPSLHTLLLNNCRKISDEALGPISCLHSLSRLELSHTCITSSSLAPLRALRHLSHLLLGSRFTLTPTTLLHLTPLTHLTALSFGTLCINSPPAAAQPFPRLASLDFGGMHINHGVQNLLPLPQLHTLTLRGLETAANPTLPHAALLPALTSLTLCGGYYLTDAGLRHLAAAPQLRRLSLAACPLVSVEGLGWVGAAGMGLTELEVWQCPRLPLSAEALRGSLPSLTSVKCTC